MKKMKIPVLFLLALLSVFCLTACGNNKNDSTTGTSAPQTSQSSSSAASESSGGSNDTGSTGDSGNNGSSAGTKNDGANAAYNENEESSSGVLDGLMDDVEQGVDDLTGDDGSRASDESK